MNAKRTLTIGLALTAFLVGGSAASRSAGFSARVDNPWYPLEPGSTYVYQGVKDAEPSREVMTVTRRTKVIDGAPCAVIRDLLYLRGRLDAAEQLARLLISATESSRPLSDACKPLFEAILDEDAPNLGNITTKLAAIKQQVNAL